MGNKIFIPQLKKEYIISKDVTILLYPFQESFTWRENFPYEKEIIYGGLKNNKLEIIHYIDIILYEDYLKQKDIKQLNEIDCFMLSSKKIDFKSRPLGAYDLRRYDLDAELYVIVEHPVELHENIIVWVPKPKSKIGKYPELIRRTDFVPDNLKGQLEIHNEYAKQVRKYELAKWKEAKKLNPLLNSKLEKFIPIKWTFKKNSEFILDSLSIKKQLTPISSENKRKISQIFVNGDQYYILQDDLNKFQIREKK